MSVFRVTEQDLDAQPIPRTRVPHVVPGCDLRKLPLSTLEAYVFSRVDGNMSENELVVCTGLESLVVAQALDRLASFGALSFSDPVERRAISQTHTLAPTVRTSHTDAPRSSHSAAPGAPAEAPRSSHSAAPRMAATEAPPSAAPRTPNTEAPRSPRSSARPHTTAPPGRISAPAVRSQFSTPPVSSGRPGPLTSATPPRASARPSGEPRALTPVPTTYRPGSVRPEYHDQLRRYLEGARTAIVEGNAAAAANYYRLAQQMAPADPTIIAALEQCNSVSAESRASSDRSITLMLLGDNAARAKQWGVAAQAYEEALSLVPKDPAILYKFAGALYRCGGQLTQAHRLVEQSIALSRNRVEAWLLLAQIRWELGQRVAAREAAEEARRLRPDDERVVKLLIKLGSVR
jgi:hypothetical protein